MDIKVPFLHQHFLLFDEYENQEVTCDKCHQKINGWAYNCESCKFWLHKSCAKQQLPHQISHPAHPQHILHLSPDLHYRKFFFCHICFTISNGHVYKCKDCNFKVDVLCASNTDGEISEKENQRSIHDRYEDFTHFRYEDFTHFSHNHSLTLFNYRRVAKYEFSCTWCDKFLSGMCYGCFDDEYCSPNFFIHQSCLLKIPFRIFQHPFHPSHPLHIQKSKARRQCNACNDTFDLIQDVYSCQKCDFSIHLLCARLQPSLKRDIHEHTLTYIPKMESSSYGYTGYQCNMCHKHISNPCSLENGNFYRCVPCNINYHLKCIPVPATTIHEYHRHHLTLVDSFMEDDSGEYYCDICEEERNSKYPIYCCEECTYISHIGCALNKVDNKALTPKITWQEEGDKKTNVESETHRLELEIEVFFHQHPLRLYEVHEEEKLMSCQACSLKISSRGYACESCDNYHLHETCTKLPHEMLHPLHPQHSLNLFANTSEWFTCHECRTFLTVGFGYVCYQCNFKLDVKCAANLTTSTNEDQRLKQMKRLSKCCPFNLAHKLQVLVDNSLFCNLCLLPRDGRFFYCKHCSYRIHESCLELFPWKIQVPIHPAHPLHPKVVQIDSSICQVCGNWEFERHEILYSCQSCPNVRLHLPCANSLNRAIIIKSGKRSHEHYLFYYGAKWEKLFRNKQHDNSKACDKCGESLTNMAFFHCLICRIDLHLKCVPIPHLIQSKCHIHPFILKDQHVEDDFGEYYCDVCEEERHPDDHVYFCEKCAFVAHIECVLKQAETSLAVEIYSNLEIEVEKLPYSNISNEYLSDDDDDYEYLFDDVDEKLLYNAMMMLRS